MCKNVLKRQAMSIISNTPMTSWYGNPFTCKHDVRLHIASTNEPKNKPSKESNKTG